MLEIGAQVVNELLSSHCLVEESMSTLHVNDTAWTIRGSSENLSDRARVDLVNGDQYLVLCAPSDGHLEALSVALPVSPGLGYCFSVPIRPDLSGCHAQIAMVWHDARGQELDRDLGPITFMSHDIATESVWGLAPQLATSAALALRLISDRTTFRESLGQLWVGEPKLAASLSVQATPTTVGALFDVDDPVSYQVTVNGAPAHTERVELSWRVLDYERVIRAQGRKMLKVSDGRAAADTSALGLAPGYHVIEFDVCAPGLAPALIWHSFGVLEPLGFNPPDDYAIALDAGLSWPPDEGYADRHSLVDGARLLAKCDICRRLGLRTLRDRWAWHDTQPERDVHELSRYVQTAQAQTDAGLSVYTVNHSTPEWALISTDDQTHRHRYPPRDVKEYYWAVRRFLRELGGNLRFFEPWNEPEIFFFQGYVWDLAALSKAAYLACKDEDSTVGVLWASRCAGPEFWRRALQNGCGPYFDIFNQHSYSAPETIFDLIAEDRAMMAEVGIERPVWMSEMGCRTDPDPDGSYLQAERDEVSYLLRSYGMGLVSGIDRFFYFYLQEFLEYGIWLWGLLRNDLSPKPSLLALAALIRQLQDAQPVGHVRQGDAYLALFQRDDGHMLALAWAAEPAMMTLSIGQDGAIYDAMGLKRQDLPQGVTELALTDQPLFVHDVQLDGLHVVPAPAAPRQEMTDMPDPVDLHIWLQPVVRPAQLYPDSSRMDQEKLAVTTCGGAIEEIAFRVHNLSDDECAVDLVLELPQTWLWADEPTLRLTVAAGESSETIVRVRVGELPVNPHACVVGRLLLNGLPTDRVCVYYQPAA